MIRRNAMLKKPVIFAVGLILLFAIVVGTAGAEDAIAPSPSPLFAQTGTAFTYQGYLEDLGSPADGFYDLEFKLYDAVTGGGQAGPTVLKDDVSVSAGTFTVKLDFTSVFDGTAYWLDIGVRPGVSTGSFTPLIPRQPLTAVPYATTALNLPTHDHFGESWIGTGTGLSLASTDTMGLVNGLWAETASDSGNGVVGMATSSLGQAFGVLGQSDSTSGTGVYGFAPSSSGITFGVHGTSDSTEGFGVYGWARATSGDNYGVHGTSDSTEGIGAYGWASATSGVNYGVHGRSDSPTGHGVVGWAAATSGENFGVLGATDSTAAGWGVYSIGDLGVEGIVYADDIITSDPKSSIVELPGKGARRLYAIESPEVWFEDFGTATLVDGSATVQIASDFFPLVNLSEDYFVFLTPLGDCELYVSSKSSTEFGVRSIGGLACNVSFDYRITAKRVDFEDYRLEAPPKSTGSGELSLSISRGQIPHVEPKDLDP
jgi:hypothetical protein